MEGPFSRVGFLDLLRALDGAVHEPSNCIRAVQGLQEITVQLYMHAEEALVWYESQIINGNIQESNLKAFKQLVDLVYTRCEEARPILIKALCQLCVVGGKLGQMAMTAVADTFRGPSRKESLYVVLEVIGPLVEIIDTFTPQMQLQVMSSLALLPCDRELAGILQPIIPTIANAILSDPWDSEYYSLLKIVCYDPDNIWEVLHYRLAEELIEYIYVHVGNSGALYQEGKEVQRLCSILDTIDYTVAGADPDVVARFTHDVLVPNLRLLIGEREWTSRLTVPQSLVCSKIINICVAIIRMGKREFDELCFGYHLFDLLLVPVKEPVADPLVMASSVYGIAAIMENPESGENFASAFCEEVDIANFLAYLKPERFSFRQYQVEEATDPVCAVANFLSRMLVLSRVLPRITGMVQIMFEKGLAILVLDALESSLLETTSKRVFVRLLSRFTIDRIDSRAIATMVNLICSSCLLDFEPEIYEYILFALEQKLDTYSMEPIVERVCWLLVSTLKTVDPKRYERVHLRCASLLKRASQSHSGKLLLREEHNSLAIKKALKYEQDFCAWDHADIRVELCCLGTDVEFLKACMFDTFRLSGHHRQIFRVLRTLGGALLEARNSASEEQLLSVNDMCLNEVEDFEDEPKLRVASELDTGAIHDLCDTPKKSGVNDDFLELSRISLSTESSLYTAYSHTIEPAASVHRDHQRQLFISMEMTTRILSYLSGLFSPGITQHFQRLAHRRLHSEYWAGRLKARKIDSERSGYVEKFDWRIKDLDGSNADRMTQVNLGHAFSKAISKTSRKLISYELGRSLADDTVDQLLVDPFFYVLSTHLLHKVWLNESNKTLNPCFIVSAYLRLLYGLMAPSVPVVVREVIKNHFRQPEFVRSLIKLACCSSFLDANLAAKFFRLCTRALTIDAFVQAESMDMIIVYDIISGFARALCVPLRDVVTTVNVNWMEASMAHIQLAMLYLFTILCLFARQTPWIKFSDILEIQIHFVEECILRFIPEEVLNFVMSVLFQIVSAETSNSVGTYVSHMYSFPLLDQLRECCVDLAVAVSSAARNTHQRQVLDLISVQRAGNSLLLRPSLVADLLRRIHLGESRKVLQEYVSKKRLERVLLLDEIWIAKEGIITKDQLLAVTSRGIQLLSVEDMRFKITNSFNTSCDLWSIDGGKLYLAADPKPPHASGNTREKSWALFTLRHTAAVDFSRFVTSDANDVLYQLASGVLKEGPIYLGICDHEDRICVVAMSQHKLALMSIEPREFAECITTGLINLRGGRYVQEPRNSANRGDDSDFPETPEKWTQPPLELQCECTIDNINRVSYDHELNVSIRVRISTEEEETWAVTFVSDSQREAFKRSLACVIGNLPWYRHWE